MACPHGIGTPATCSQCLRATVRKCERDPITGQMKIDGRPIDRKFQPYNYGYQAPPRKRTGRPTNKERQRRADAELEDDIE